MLLLVSNQITKNTICLHLFFSYRWMNQWFTFPFLEERRARDSAGQICLPCNTSQREHKNRSNILALHSFFGLSTVSYLRSNCPYLHIHSDSVILGKHSREAYYSLPNCWRRALLKILFLKVLKAHFLKLVCSFFSALMIHKMKLVHICKMIFRLTDSLCDGFATGKAVTMA